MQKLTIIGNVGSDAVIRTPKAGGEGFLSFNVACNESYTNGNGEKIEKTVWYDCTFKKTNLAAYIKKGDQIYVEGKPEYGLYQDKQGQHFVTINLAVRDIRLLNNKKE